MVASLMLQASQKSFFRSLLGFLRAVRLARLASGVPEKSLISREINFCFLFLLISIFQKPFFNFKICFLLIKTEKNQNRN